VSALDNSIYADTAQARATDRRDEPVKPVRRMELSDEEIKARQQERNERQAEEDRRSRARVRNALSQMDAFFARPAPKPTAS